MLANARDFRLAVRHEIQHHRQGDTSWAVLIEFLVCFFFPNPAIYIWKREITEFQEFSCDEALIGRKDISSHDYGSCLVRVAEAALGVRQMYAGTTCMAADSRNPNYFKSFLRRRVEMFTNHKKPPVHRLAGILVGTLATVFTIALAVSAEQSMRSNDQPIVNPGSISVDPAIQEIADKALGDAIKNENAKSGFAIVADPNTGRVLAVANIDTTGQRLGRWALSQRFEPASLTKPLVAAQALEMGLTTPQENHSCENGSYSYGGRTYHDWKTTGWDHLSTEDTIAFSGDICSIKIGEKVGIAGLQKMLINFGFGSEGSAKSFPEARPGVLPFTERATYPDFIPAVSDGYGFQVTSIEVVQAYGAIANGGNLMTPEFAAVTQGQVVRRVLSLEKSQEMKAILEQVVLKGTAKGHANSELYSTAGKTATAYTPDLTQWDLVEGKKKGNFAGFIGFAPVKEPRVEVFVGIRDPHTDQKPASGGTDAAPVFKQITESVLKYMNVAPDKPQS
jgi:hypothetical protein